MSVKNIKTIKTENVLVSYMYLSKADYFTVSEMRKLGAYLYEQLNKKNILDNYSIKFSIDDEEIKHMCMHYLTDIFVLNDYWLGIFQLKKDNIEEWGADYLVDDTINELVQEWIETY